MANTVDQRKSRIQARIDARYAKAEAKAKAEAQGDPSFEEVFTNYQGYMTYLGNLPPEERKMILGDLTEEANALVDEPFDKETTRLKQDLDLKIRSVNQQYGSLDEGTQRELSQAIARADRDTVDALTGNFEAIMSRGLMNGGILTQLADKVLRNKEAYVNEIRADADAVIKDRAESKALTEEGIRLYGEDRTADISDRRRIARSVQESELFTEQGTLKFIQDMPLASRLLPQELATQLDRLNNSGTQASETADTTSTTPVPTAPTSRVPSGYTPRTTPQRPPVEDKTVATPDKQGVISLTQRRILAGPRPSLRGTRQAASQY